jgi:hypothetical protein
MTGPPHDLVTQNIAFGLRQTTSLSTTQHAIGLSASFALPKIRTRASLLPAATSFIAPPRGLDLNFAPFR